MISVTGCFSHIEKIICRLFDFNPIKISTNQRIIFWILMSLFCISFMKSVHDLTRWNGVDLRPKITGARAIFQNINPYNINWNPGMSEKLLDPKEGHPPGPSRVTYSPATLVIYIPYSFLPYKFARWIWWLTEWICMFFSIYLLSRIISSKGKKFIFACITLLFFCSSYFWRLHLERGQYYIFLVLLISTVIYFSLKNSDKDFLIGIILGILVLIRVTFLPIILFLWIFKKRKIVISMFISICTVFLITIAIMGPNIWTSYYNNINEWQKMAIHQSNNVKYEYKSEYPIYAEGLDLRHFLERKSLNETFWIRLKNDLGIEYNYSYNRYAIILMILFFSLISFKYRKINNQNLMWLMIFSTLIFIEFFAPQRHIYTNVILLPLVALFFNMSFNKFHLFGLLLSFSIGHTLLPLNTPLIPTWSKHIIFFMVIFSIILDEVYTFRNDKNLKLKG